ncbi:ABC transporter ATP-binding protein [Saccharomonospora iraqiensis]|uniref:ABC transporter ATP-binding protein n=1 Tax=Saccharomonospora iraqiensis TaxID=52698 RepID=UPI000421E751|nr:ATP-binding cassette domain-containing protein [Saccharomonospora iraqiensis]
MTPGDTTPDDVVLRGTDLRRSHRAGDRLVPVLHGVTLSARRASVTVLEGPSGSGKSTLLRLLAGLDRPDDGTVELAGTELTRLSARRRRALRRTRISWLHQEPTANLVDYLTAAEHVELAARLRRCAVDVPAVLDLVDLAHRARHRPRALSGGEQQRVALAAAVVGAPDVVVADEPSAHLDPAATGHVAEVLRRLAGRGTTVLLASHDPRITRLADATVRLVDGRNAESPEDEDRP